MNLVVNVSDLQVSANPDAVLVTYSLGSCIAVAAYDAVTHVGGMLHFQLPSSTLDPDRARQSPLMFADSGVERMIATMSARGADKRRVKVKLAGGAQMLADNALFNIGRRNHTAVRKVLWQQGLFVDAESIGGSAPRNMYLALSNGAVTVKTANDTFAL